MKILLVFATLFFSFLSCEEPLKNKNTDTKKLVVDTTIDSYGKILAKREQTSAEKQTDNLGTLINTISFNEKTNNKKDFEEGIIPWVSIEDPNKDLHNLIGGNVTVIHDTNVTVIIDYPLTQQYQFEMTSKNGFTRENLLKEIRKRYYKIYAEEEESATVKTVPVDKRTTMYNRNETNGKYGIWGHDIGDLVLAEILVYKDTKG